MILDLYEYLTSFRETGGDMVQRLRDIGVEEVFEPLIKDELFKDADKFNSALFYILDCYSKSSKKHIAGAEWITIKKSVAKSVKLPDNLYDSVLNLENEGVSETIQKYLIYQHESLFTQLCMQKDLRQQMVKAATSDLSKPGKVKVIDYEQKHKCAQKAVQLLKDIATTELELFKALKKDTGSGQQMHNELDGKTNFSVNTGLSIETSPEIA